MAQGFETRIKILKWGIWNNQGGKNVESVWGDTALNNAVMFQRMAEALTEINAQGWQVVSTIPLDQGAYFGTGLMNQQGAGAGTWGGGYGYGSSATAGTAMVLQRQIDDAGTQEAAERAKQYAAELENSAKAWSIRYQPIEKKSTKSTFSSKDEFLFDGQSYSSMALAENARSEAAAAAERGRRG